MRRTLLFLPLILLLCGLLGLKALGSGITGSSTGGGSGNVVGPSTSDNNYLAVFDGTTGSLLKQSSFYVDTSSGTSTLIGPAIGTSSLDGFHKTNISNDNGSVRLNIPGDMAFSRDDAALTIYDNTMAQDCVVLSRTRKSDRFTLTDPAVTDNSVVDGPYDVDLSHDTVLVIVTDNNGIATGASTDNVAFNFGYCPANATTWANCFKMFSADKVATGAATNIFTPDNAAMLNTYRLRFVISAVNNMTGKKIYVNRRYYEKLP